MTAERWVVLEGDWGGQVYASVPVRLLPAWGRRKRVRKALALLNRLNWPGQEDGTNAVVYEEVEPFDECAAAEREDLGPFLEARGRLEAAQDAAERGVVCTFTLPHDRRAWEERDTHLRSWKLVGCVPGGMGGGRLVDDDLWLHDHVLSRGLGVVNRVRALLGLAPLPTLDVAWDERRREHARFCNRLHLRRRSRGRRARVRARRAG